MWRIIVNADDCGKSSQVDAAIESTICDGKLSSTTIMANMPDLKGAYRLYNAYHEKISFGWHINLTEGRPVRDSQLLLDKGFIIESGGIFTFNAEQFETSRYKFLDKRLRGEIMKELIAQYTRLLDYGFNISHIDSHHHIHTSLFMFRILPELTRLCHINKIRNIRNIMPLSLNFMGRKAWSITQKTMCRSVVMTDYFEDYSQFQKLYSSDGLKIPGNATIELMCHPGHPIYKDESFLKQRDVFKDYNAELISYNEL